MTSLLAAAAPPAPTIDWAGLAPLVILIIGSIIVLIAGLAGPRPIRTRVVPLLTLATLAVTIASVISLWGENTQLIEGALQLDPLTLILTLLICGGAVVATLLAWRERAAEEIAHGEFFALMLLAVAGMFVLVASRSLVSTFVGLELLSLPLYILCAARVREERSLEAGLKYLIVGSVGSATVLYGFALLYGATGETGYNEIASKISSAGLATDPLVLAAVAMCTVGFAFKASLAPFHQWTPDVYEGAPTPVTAFMSIATKAAAFGVIIRLFDVALRPAIESWRPIWIGIALITMVVGNVGALRQSSMKRMLAYSSIAQAGYILVGFVIVTDLGVQAICSYLILYTFGNLAAFVVVVARERETTEGDNISALRGLGSQRPLLAAVMTLAMLSLAGIPATAGFMGKLRLIEAAAAGDYAWLAAVLVVLSVISMAYYLPVIAVMWRGEAQPGTDPATGVPALAGGAPEADGEAGSAGWELTAVGVLLSAAVIVFGIVPQPVFNLVASAARGLGFN
ncbi:MAG: NADH-quinone oxidoreductase subunit NuoN [Actinobacteria bacterium]|uniref:Unannotated protein n=1 Tax=freshwater metagenome TaxID=449393 RepID=A0A6J5ZVG5_9ZZZZ|nr:NADH-quinone oxidoreductase subunit NuoN [Actinomycetota bacterium]